jgi:hypothetical protein
MNSSKELNEYLQRKSFEVDGYRQHGKSGSPYPFLGVEATQKLSYLQEELDAVRLRMAESKDTDERHENKHMEVD